MANLPFVYQNGKLYLHKDSGLVGVEIYSDKVIKVKGTETKMDATARELTIYEIKCKFHLSQDNPYIFPVEKKVDAEVKANGTVRDTKKPVGKSTRK